MNYLLYQCTSMNLDIEILFFVILVIFEDYFSVEELKYLLQ